ncbi:AAC(3) family N-acetyltransferase [Kitasatospora sp. YST-16]|uniref:aminoglycoside N(3)-acetyltransferase n=1 Tax=Kitasatospora sp. YST-16 TaxID=2998080 RepID=UPI00228475FD|nr:AAC(3) family N-acetyltransferase [Kitasatospora sp. YST-16]WAL73369.1 AAC(3) family N-acetyltransferase [Kitasatospora sp. YST-16]WNW39425.1 AAC(3) family N-acetyltransferase [Streptomyces sp. Li-HN-5-13]
MTGTVVRPGLSVRTGRYRPWTVDQLAEQLRELGVQEGGILLVQSSLRAIGPVEGGANGVVEALLAALGARGTLVVYTATPENSRTSPDYLAVISGKTPAQLAEYHRQMPGWNREDTAASPTMGRLSEVVRKWPGAVRSAHPQTSFAALGPAAESLTAEHPFSCHLGDDSPNGQLYRNGAQSLLLGAPMACCTPLHLLEYWQPNRPEQDYTCVRWTPEDPHKVEEFTGLRLQIAHFEEMGEMLIRELGSLRRGRVGGAESILMPIPDAVDLAYKWFVQRRS